jgi:serine/threonine-protein kinase
MEYEQAPHDEPGTDRVVDQQPGGLGLVGGRYRLLEQIGEGGMSRVYGARDRVLDRIVAVKLLREEYGGDPGFVARFYREARAAASLQHPNIVDIYDYGPHDSTYYIAMQYIEGTDLKAILRHQGAFPPQQAVEVLREVLRALGAAHARGIIHRDVKPQNILVRASDGAIKLTDFGVARALDGVDLTTSGAAPGTAHYMAPEQGSGEPVTPATDLYAAGVVFFELLSGELPFTGSTPMQVMLQHLREPPPPVPNAPPALDRVVHKALMKDPAHRYQSAEEMLAALDAAVASLAGAGGSPTRVMPLSWLGYR